LKFKLINAHKKSSFDTFFDKPKNATFHGLKICRQWSNSTRIFDADIIVSVIADALLLMQKIKPA
jgi:hypothetical protein